MEQEKVKAFKRYLANLASFFARKNVIVDITTNPTYVGYTSKPKNSDAQIVLSSTAPLYKDLGEDQIMLYIMGVCAHETLHLIYTPFKTFESIILQYRTNEGEYIASQFKMFANIIEDVAIELEAPNVFGGKYLKALLGVIKHTYNTSPNIDSLTTKGSEEAFAYVQICNALIQLGDRGSVKGNFTSEQAKKYFAQVLPLFNKSVTTANGSERCFIAKEAFEVVKPLLKKQKEEEENNSILNDALSNLLNNKDIASCGDTNGLDTSSSESAEAKKLNEAIQRAINNVNNDSMDENDSTDNAAKQAGSTTEEQNATDTEFSQEEINAIKKGVEEEQMKLEASEEENAEAISRKGTEVDMSDSMIEHNVISVGNEVLYNSVYSQYSVISKNLCREIKKIFSGDTGGTMNSMHGAKINVKRIATPILHNEIMLSRQRPKELRNMSIILLIDESGSMRYGVSEDASNAERARDAAIILQAAFKSLDIPMYIMGFSGDVYKLHHDIFMTWSSPDSDRYTLTEMCAKGMNYDGPTIEEATRLSLKYGAKHQLLIVISDGTPNSVKLDGETETANAINYARKKGISVVGVALNCSDECAYNRMYGKDYITVSTMDDIARPLISTLKQIVRSW